MKERQFNRHTGLDKPRYASGVFGLTCAGLALLGVLIGCGSAPGAGSSPTAASTTSSPAIITASDAPLSNVLSAVVTLSSINVSDGSGSTAVSLLSAPVTVELSGLGAVQEPIELASIPSGTYSSVTLGVSSAQVTYLNSSGQPVSATATLPQPTVTVALAPALTVSNSGEVHLNLGFNLAQSFSISGSTVSFAPALTTLADAVSAESEADRSVELTGSVVSVSPTSITIQSGDSGHQFTLSINSATAIAGGGSSSSIQVGAIVQAQGQTQSDGSLLALTLTPESTPNSGEQQDGAKGIIVSVTQGSTGAITGFTMVPRESFGTSSSTSATVDVTVGSATSFGLPEDAAKAGLAPSSFTTAQIFAGQSVTVTGAIDASGNIGAQRVTLAEESIAGTVAATPQASGAGFAFGLTLPAGAYLTTDNIASTLNIITGAQTEFDNGLSASSFGTLASGTNIELHGYLMKDALGTAQLTATQISTVSAPETPESGN